MSDKLSKKTNTKSTKSLGENAEASPKKLARKAPLKTPLTVPSPIATALAGELKEAAEYEQVQNWGAAETTYRQILEKNPQCGPAWHSLGLLAFNLGNLNLAVQHVARAVQCEPMSLIYQRNFGELSRRLGHFDHAIAGGIAATKINPKDIDAHYNLGLAYTDAKDYPKAITAYRRALKINPMHGLSWNNLGSALEQQGDKEGALKAYSKAVELNESHAEAQNNQGAIFSELGKLDEARSAFEAAIAASPHFVEAHYNISSLKTYTKQDPHLQQLEEIVGDQASLNDDAKIRYNFALGKALEDTAQYDRAFASYEIGNRLQHALLPMDESNADALVDDILKVFSKEFFEKRQDWTGNSKSPIFIVGMPRSGTTLLEQILSTHPAVYGAGELMDLNEVIAKLTKAADSGWFSKYSEHLSEKDIQALGAEYTKRVWALSPKSQWITDKMPANFFYIGLIYLAFPNAKIIHAMRDPMDSCFSCYSRLFNDTMEFAYDLQTLGRYYNRYIRLMDHWHSVLPKDRILDLHYEELVENTEEQARRILEYVGIPWDPKCLDFHQNKRIVKTASVAQVRKPIYKTSVARWRHFEKHLQPLMQLVAPERLGSLKSELPLVVSMPSESVAGPKTLIDQCLALQSQNKHQDVIQILQPDASFGELQAHAHHLRGISLYRLNRFVEAKQSYETALSIEPHFPLLLNSYGFLLQDMGLINEAHNAFARAVELAPEFAMARLNLGMAQLKLGDWKNGWDNYESRWIGSAESANPQFKKPVCPLPQWDGQGDTQGKSLLVITEQGFGDTFQFARYLKLASEKFARVGFVSSLPTLRLMEWGLGDRVVLLSQMPTNYSAWDWYCPLMSLPRAFETRLNTIPQEVPYFHILPPVKQYWKERLDQSAPGRFRVGIAWAGRKTHQYDGRRSLALEQLMPILQHPGISWLSLQKWNPQEARPVLPAQIDWIDWTDDFSDFADTAALISNLDLVISIDSSMVHLAGALNKPVWMLNRFDSEWRWLNRRTDSPWYPNLRIFNQPSFGDWQTVIQEVQASLNALRIPNAPRVRAPEIVSTVGGLQPTQIIPPSSLNIEQSIQLASQLQGAGRLPEAESLLQQVLQKDPKHANALHLLGLIAHQSGNPIRAIELVKAAIAAKSDVALFHSNLAEISRQAGNVTAAIEFGEQAIALDPLMPSAFSNLGVALYDAARYDESITMHQKALLLEPHSLQSLNNLGSIARAKKNKSEAIDWYRKALNVQPEFLESLSNLGAVLVESDRAAEAVPALEKALKLAPNYPEALCNLGLAQVKLDAPEIAKGLLERSLQLRPNYSEALSGLARVHQDLDQLPQAESLLKQALITGPARSDVYSQLGMVYTEMGQTDAAEEAFKKALELESDSLDALNGIGNLKIEAGDIEEAKIIFSDVIDRHPDNLDARFHLMQIEKSRPGDQNLLALEAMLPTIDTFGSDKQISLHYALGKGYEDQRDFDQAFLHFSKGAKLKRSKLNYDWVAEQAFVERIKNTFTSELFNRLKNCELKETSNAPVFILGMPRSGTTLTEQIISSHPSVYGAGELRDLIEITQNPLSQNSSLSYPENLQVIEPSQLFSWGREYVERLKAFDPAALRITDKMPSNYLLLGLISAMLPGAKIIHVKRNPIDTCLSCYTRLFNRHQDATYDLAELGRHYMNYYHLMEHWKKILPPDSFIEVQYEEIVADIESQARRLIDYCGLEWNEGCLAFYENKRSVRTASVAQVRKPLYTSSVEKWRQYESHLGPLLEQLAPIL